MDSLLMLIVSFVLGVALYLIDVKRGVKWYHKWYNLTHKEPVEVNYKGFIHLRGAYQKLTVAIVFSGLFFLIMLFFGGNPIVHLLTSAVMLVGFMIGFYMATPVLKFLPGGVKELDKILKKADEVERIIHANDPNAKSEPSTIPVSDEKEKTEEVKPDPQEKAEPKNKDDDKDWRGGIDEYLKK
jgi:hypothetical protein